MVVGKLILGSLSVNFINVTDIIKHVSHVVMDRKIFISIPSKDLFFLYNKLCSFLIRVAFIKNRSYGPFCFCVLRACSIFKQVFIPKYMQTCVNHYADLLK